MRLLAVADEEDKGLWDYYSRDKLQGAELILACGDLDYRYLEFLATMAAVPVFYVHGNHDECYDTHPPEGVTCLDDRVVVYNGLRIAGLGGACRYRTGAWQFTEAEMKKRVNRLRARIDRCGGLDVLVTHAPLHGYGDMTDLAHRGFTVFHELLDRYRPQLMLHGHVHLNYGRVERALEHPCGTQVINACGSYIFDFPDDRIRARDPFPVMSIA